MNTANVLRLVVLAAIWGSSFLFMRISAPVLGPALPLFPVPGEATVGIMGAALALGVMCSGIAYLLYFKLIADAGPTSALTVTFLNPLFGILWGAIFLHEVIGWYTIVGAAIVIAGTMLVTGFRPAFLRPAAARCGAACYPHRAAGRV